MSHFNTPQYLQFRSKIYSSIKKTLQSKIEQVAQTQITDLHPCDGNDEVVIDGNYFNFTYKDEFMQLPAKLLEVKNFHNLFNMQTICQNFQPQQINELYELLPANQKNINGLKYALDGNKKTTSSNNLIPQSPLEDFQRKLKKGYFTSLREKQDQINELLDKNSLRKYYSNLYEQLSKKRQNKARNSEKKQLFSILDNQSVHDFQPSNQLSDNSQMTQTQEQFQQQIQEQCKNHVFFKYDYSKIKTQQQLLAMGEERTEKRVVNTKIVSTLKPRNQQWIQSYRKQQLQRYANPTKPWIYICEDNRKVSVAPVAKKTTVVAGKPRDHHMLKIQRPACVTILTLVRDAAARLPNGVGTRADICQLLKQSQYVTDDLPQEKLSSIVSGALDRLHYMSDACVKYDSEKKLWIYLHTDRNYEHPGWGQDGQEYVEKKSYKKKKAQNYD